MTTTPVISTYVDFTVVGTPVQQGSMVRTKSGMRHVKGNALTTWREAVAHACRESMRDPRRHVTPIYAPWAEPVRLELWFYYQPKRKADSDQPKATAPDLDKLVRAVLDALTGVLYADDRQVVKIEAYKNYGDWAPRYEGGPEETYLSVNAMRVVSS